MLANLPQFFAYKSAADLIRVGRDYDGGYLVSHSDIKNSDILISLGICDDWSFEMDFVKYNDVDVNAYDASVNLRFWIKRIIMETLKNPFNLYPIRKLISYNYFFRGNKKHIKKFIGFDSKDKSYCTLSSIFDSLNSQNIFLKIDIEGSEYRIFDTIVRYQNRISGLVLEMHDCDLHMDAIESFINKLNLNIVHIHVNNHSPIRLDDSLPLILEITFSKNCTLSDETDLPHKLDMPNIKNQPVVNITFNK